MSDSNHENYVQPTLPPHSQEAEDQLLGAVLINPSIMVELVYVRQSHFFVVRNGWVWGAMRAIYERGETIEMLAVVEELRGAGQLDDAGGVAFLAGLAAGVADSTQAITYARLVWRLARRRALMKIAGDLDKFARNETMDFPEVMRQADAVFSAWQIENEEGLQEGAITLAQAAADSLETMDERLTPDKRGVLFGVSDLDKKMGGIQQGKLCVLAMDTGGGKSAAGVTLTHNALNTGKRVIYFSLEMPRDEIIDRLVAMRTGISGEKQEVGDLTPEEIKIVTQARLDINQMAAARRIYIDDRSTLSITKIDEEIRRLEKRDKAKIDLIIVDHTRLLSVPGISSDNLTVKMATIAEDLKRVARDRQVGVLALWQFRNDIPAKTDMRPSMQYLYGGAAPKQAADVILIGHRPEMYTDDPDPEMIGRIDVYCEKKRGGASGWKTTLRFLKEKTMWANATIVPTFGQSAAD